MVWFSARQYGVKHHDQKSMFWPRTYCNDLMHISLTLTEHGLCSSKPARVSRALAQHCPVLLRQLRPTAAGVWQEGVYHSQPGSQAQTSRQQHNSIQGATPLLLQGAAADAGWSRKPVPPQVHHSPHLCLSALLSAWSCSHDSPCVRKQKECYHMPGVPFAWNFITC